MDIFPTIAEIVGLPEQASLRPQDGLSLQPLFSGEIGPRTMPIPFNCFGDTALIDNDTKLIYNSNNGGRYELYDLANDPAESRNLMAQKSDVGRRLRQLMKDWQDTLADSRDGKDYPEGRVDPGEPKPKFWTEVEAYKPYFDEWRGRPEYKSRLK
jgi:arylsulfatase A-like enzyme